MSVRPSELPTRHTERAVKRTGFRPDIEGLRAGERL